MYIIDSCSSYFLELNWFTIWCLKHQKTVKYSTIFQTPRTQKYSICYHVSQEKAASFCHLRIWNLWHFGICYLNNQWLLIWWWSKWSYCCSSTQISTLVSASEIQCYSGSRLRWSLKKRILLWHYMLQNHLNYSYTGMKVKGSSWLSSLLTWSRQTTPSRHWRTPKQQ